MIQAPHARVRNGHVMPTSGCFISGSDSKRNTALKAALTIRHTVRILSIGLNTLRIFTDNNARFSANLCCFRKILYTQIILFPFLNPFTTIWLQICHVVLSLYFAFYEWCFPQKGVPPVILCLFVSRCMPSRFRCDGTEHCADGTDEVWWDWWQWGFLCFISIISLACAHNGPCAAVNHSAIVTLRQHVSPSKHIAVTL